MTTVSVDLSESLLSATRYSPEEFTREMRLAAAMTWYREGRISQEVAARVAGLDRTDFLLELARHGCDSFHVDLVDLERELNGRPA
jgi:predicted HTH domain antitoxin